MKVIFDSIFRLTPLGRADQDLRQYVENKDYDEELLSKYEIVLAKYRTNKMLHNIVKVLLYAGIITSVATTFGIEQVEYIAQIASYIGVSVLLVLFSVTKYFSELYREEYHVKREILISEVN
ncbi:MAG: hypothetical protein R6V35_04145 [Candidatus Nanohaloarchaea archaeon]